METRGAVFTYEGSGIQAVNLHLSKDNWCCVVIEVMHGQTGSTSVLVPLFDLASDATDEPAQPGADAEAAIEPRASWATTVG